MSAAPPFVTAAASKPGSVKSSAAPAASTSVSNAFVCGGGGVTACVTGAEGVRWDMMNLISSHAMSSNIKRFAYTANVNARVCVERRLEWPSSREEASRSFFVTSRFASRSSSRGTKGHTARMSGTRHGDVCGCCAAASDAISRGACGSSKTTAPASSAS